MAVFDTLTERRAVRRVMIRLAQKRQRPGSGSSAEFLRQRTSAVLFPDLNAVLPVEWAVVGAAAARLYMPERATQDFDILVRASDASVARDALRHAGFTYTNELSIGGSSWKTSGGFPVDVLESDSP